VIGLGAHALGRGFGTINLAPFFFSEQLTDSREPRPPPLGDGAEDHNPVPGWESSLISDEAGGASLTQGEAAAPAGCSRPTSPSAPCVGGASEPGPTGVPAHRLSPYGAYAAVGWPRMPATSHFSAQISAHLILFEFTGNDDISIRRHALAGNNFFRHIMCPNGSPYSIYT